MPIFRVAFDLTDTVRFTACDERRHPRCAGVVTEPCVERPGIQTLLAAEDYGSDAIGDECLALEVARNGGILLTS